MSGRMTISAAAPRNSTNTTASSSWPRAARWCASTRPPFRGRRFRHARRLSTPIPLAALGRTVGQSFQRPGFGLVCAAVGRPSNRFFWTSVWSPVLVIFTLPRRCSGPVFRRGAGRVGHRWARRSPGRGHSRGPRGGDSRGGYFRDHVQPNGELGYFQHAFQVYGRTGEACVNAGCGRPISAWCKPGARLSVQLSALG